MSNLAIQGIVPQSQVPALDIYSSTNEVSTGFLADMATKAASKLSAHVTKIENEEHAALQNDLGNPGNMMRLEKVEADKGMTFSFTATLVGKLPKALEILNK